MAMRFRELAALNRESESREMWAAEMKSGAAVKEFRKEREALEKVHGGAKKLAEAEKILADAEASSAEITVALTNAPPSSSMVSGPVFVSVIVITGVTSAS